MKVKYDAEADALYVTLTDAIVSRTVEIDVGTLVDLDSKGRPVGIEVLQPARMWPLREIVREFDLESEDQTLLLDLFDQPKAFPYLVHHAPQSAA